VHLFYPDIIESNPTPVTHSLFAGHRRLAVGTLVNVTAAFLAHERAGDAGPLLIFEDATGKQVDVDRTGTVAAPQEAPMALGEPVTPDDGARRGPGRPRLGVVPREVTLLPHHWEWLNAQPGGASVTLRKLVEHARKAGAADERIRLAREAAYRFLHAVGGNLPDFEEVTRALFAGDLARMDSLMGPWPDDVRSYARQLATPRE
jgi:hypothetical protein